jgi:hypothetical protein
VFRFGSAFKGSRFGVRDGADSIELRTRIPNSELELRTRTPNSNSAPGTEREHELRSENPEV